MKMNKMTSTELILLIHGFGRTSSDMLTLNDYLEELGCCCSIVNLNTTFGSLEECTQALQTEITYLSNSASKISLVGHSMGGLIIRNYLANNIVSHLGRCVLIATPNSGSKLANLALASLQRLPINSLKGLNCLTTYATEISPPLNKPLPEIGVIAGNKNNLFWGRFLSSSNDGRVEVESVKFPQMKEFIELPFGHHEIHYEAQTACLVHRFLTTGSFAQASQSITVFQK